MAVVFQSTSTREETKRNNGLLETRVQVRLYMITPEQNSAYLESFVCHQEDIVAHSFVAFAMTFDFVIHYYCENNVLKLFTTIPPHRINLRLVFHPSNSVTE
jgi:hypothetical protein